MGKFPTFQNQNQKEELIKGQLKDTPEKSNNQIGKMLGVDDHTVEKYRKELEESSEIPNFSKHEEPRTGELSQPAEKETEADSKNVRSWS